MDASGDDGGQRFGRSLRLLRPAEYKRVFSDARRSVDGVFTVLFAGNQLTHPRLGLAIAKKQVKSAVVRNRVKRVIRESFRTHRHLLPPLDIVVLARRGAAEKSTAELHRSLRGHWERIRRQCAG